MWPELIYITDSAQADPLKAVKRLPPNSMVILRDYELPENERLELGLKLKKACKKQGFPLLVAKTLELAVEINADGIHLPEFMVEKTPEIRRKQPFFIITAASHSRRASYKAAKLGVDAVLISPVFATKSHQKTRPLGIHRAKKMAVPYIYSYALGGARRRNILQMQLVGFQGVAGVSGVA